MKNKTTTHKKPEPPKPTQMAVRDKSTLSHPTSLPDYMRGAVGMGTSLIDRDDMTLPRLALCQSMTPQRKKGSANYIPGLEEGDFFNTLTGEIYEAPLKFLPINFQKSRIKFHPLEEGGTIDCQSFNSIDGGHYAPRCAECEHSLWSKGEDGKGKPSCLLFFNYVSKIFPKGKEPTTLMISMKSASIKVGKSFNTMVRMFAGNIMFSRYYELTPVIEKNNMGEFYNYSVKALEYVDKETFAAAVEVCEGLQTRTVTMDVTGIQEEDVETASADM